MQMLNLVLKLKQLGDYQVYQNSGGKIEFYGSEMSVSYKDSLNVFIYLSGITKYIQTMHIYNI